jgi:hypothetical protein
MSPHPQNAKKKFIIATLLLLMTLACGPLYRLQEFNRQNQVTPTATSPTGKKNELNIAAAFAKTQTLPGYRFEHQHIFRDDDRQIKLATSGEVDSWGNLYLLDQSSEGQTQETFVIDDRVYEFSSKYQGWINSTDPSDLDDNIIADLTSVKKIIQLTTHAGTVPIEIKQETLLNRRTRRYSVADTVQSDQTQVDLRGTLWIDDETGAIIKLELFLYRDSDSLPAEEFILSIDNIGNVETITIPSPVVNPTTADAATETAQSQQALPAKMNYQGEIIKFDVIPMKAIRLLNSAPRQAEIVLMLNRLPGNLFLEESFDPFLAQLREQLTLSIPEQNLVVTSAGYQLADKNPINRTLKVSFTFNADLENQSHVELILAGPGNPIIMPVPVE